MRRAKVSSSKVLRNVPSIVDDVVHRAARRRRGLVDGDVVVGGAHRGQVEGADLVRHGRRRGSPRGDEEAGAVGAQARRSSTPRRTRSVNQKTRLKNSRRGVRLGPAGRPGRPAGTSSAKTGLASMLQCPTSSCADVRARACRSRTEWWRMYSSGRTSGRPASRRGAGRDESGHRCGAEPGQPLRAAETCRSCGAVVGQVRAQPHRGTRARRTARAWRPARRRPASEGVLLRRVLDIGDGIPGAMHGTDGRDGVPAGPVGGVGEPRVVSRQLDPTGRTREARSVRRHDVKSTKRPARSSSSTSTMSRRKATHHALRSSENVWLTITRWPTMSSSTPSTTPCWRRSPRDGRYVDERAGHARCGVSAPPPTAASSACAASRSSTGFTRDHRPGQAGFGVTALILPRRPPGRLARRPATSCWPCRACVYLAMTSGAFDMVMLVRAADVHHLRDVVLGELHGCRQVRSTQTVFVLEEHGPLPLPRTQER